jgi:hypothetical protein
MNLGEQTALGGTLIHWDKNIWAWSDNSSAPNVRDMTSSQYYNFPTRANQWIEVLVQAPWENDDLHWVPGNYEISLSGDRHGQFVIDEVGRIIPASQIGIVIPEVYVVPISDWDANDGCVAANWCEEDHEAIVSKARSLGWNAEEGQ